MKKENVKVGMKVRIVKPKLVFGYSDEVYWKEELNDIVGKEFTVKELNDISVKLNEYYKWYLPYKALKKVKPDSHNKIKVGDIVCVTDDTVEIHKSNVIDDITSVPKIGQVAVVLDKFKEDGWPVILIHAEDRYYLTIKSQVVKVINNIIIT